MSSYSKKLKDPRWQRLRLEIFERDEFKCRDCQAADKTLHVHHCFYNRGEPRETPARFLLTLCEECHEDRQGLEDDARRALGTILANTSGKEGPFESDLYTFVSGLIRQTYAFQIATETPA